MSSNRVIPDGAHHSGLTKDYGGRYNPDYVDPTTKRRLHPYCQECGWRKGGIDSWDGKACKCGLSESPIVMVSSD